MEAPMKFGTIAARAGGILSTVLGGALIILSGGVTASIGRTRLGGVSLDIGEKAADMMGRAGFAFLLMGLLAIFLFSFKAIPDEMAASFLKTESRNIGRVLAALNLKGMGIYVPPGGRLKEDRVYVPFEKARMPLPALSDPSVFNVGTTDPSMGISIIPPGKGLVDLSEKETGRRFSEGPTSAAQEALDRLSKGTGLYGSVQVRPKGDIVEVTIVHSKLASVCEEAWTATPKLHEWVGCPGCSAVLCALARVHRKPLRIRVARSEKGRTIYELERE